MNSHIKRALAIILGLQASYAVASAEEPSPQKFRFVENLSANERIDLGHYLSDLENQGYKVDLSDRVIVIDKDNRVFFLKKSPKLLQLMRATEEPSCMSGGSGVARQ
jgi:hypothetical protein